MSEWTLASVKGALAAAGADLAPDAEIYTYRRPTGGRGPVVILERVKDLQGPPEYQVCGFATCVSCDEMCYLGDRTSQVVLDLTAFPLCLRCARVLIPPDSTADRRLLDDH